MRFCKTTGYDRIGPVLVWSLEEGLCGQWTFGFSLTLKRRIEFKLRTLIMKEIILGVFESLVNYK